MASAKALRLKRTQLYWWSWVTEDPETWWGLWLLFQLSHRQGFFFFLLFLLLFIWLCWVLVVTHGIQLPDQGLNLSPLHWEHGVLATGPPGKSPTGRFNAATCHGTFVACMLWETLSDIFQDSKQRSVPSWPASFCLKVPIHLLTWLQSVDFPALMGKCYSI